MKRARLIHLLAIIWTSLAAQQLSAACLMPAHRAALEALKSSKFEVADDKDRQTLALSLLTCLADPDPALRDGLAFEAYYTWLRGDRLDEKTRTALLTHLSSMIEPGKADGDGFQQPFAALVLSEVARTDRIKPWLEPAQRAALVEQAARYEASVRDYRGFDPKEGWRHGVAHGSDLLLQLVLNPGVDRAGIDRILDAVAVQVAPAGDHSYIDGESERLARPVLFAAQRGLLSAEDWQKWLGKVAAPLPNAQAAIRTRAGLAHQHNLQAFLYALYVNAREGGDANMQLLLPGLQAAFKTL
ncbi:MAG: DUF2785 domain-containing protein [Pseudomonadota bacterium]